LLAQLEKTKSSIGVSDIKEEAELKDLFALLKRAN